MADFATWSHDNLVRFAQEAQERIAELEEDLKLIQALWRQALAQNAALDTLNSQPQGANREP